MGDPMSGPRGTILIVDDDFDTAESLRLILENEGYAVQHAANGLEGVNLARTDPPDLIFLDILMQKKDGLTTFGELKNDATLAAIPVIMLTSVSERLGFSFTSDDMETYYGKAPEAFMKKPFDPPMLLKTVKELIKG